MLIGERGGEVTYMDFISAVLGTAAAAGLVLGVVWLGIQVWRDFKDKP